MSVYIRNDLVLNSSNISGVSRIISTAAPTPESLE